MKQLLSIIALTLLCLNVYANKTPLKVGVLLYEGAEVIDFTGPVEVLGAAGYDITTITEDGSPITTWPKLTITPDHSFDTAPNFDILLVPGGDASKAIESKATLKWVKKRTQKVQSVVSVCTGAFILAESGVLNGLKATTFYPVLEELDKKYSKITTITDQRFVDSGKIITAAGLSSGIDAALYLVAKNEGERRARSIAMLLEYDWQPEKGFTRGKMADTHLPKLLPEEPEYKREYSFGDESEWLDVYYIKNQNDSGTFNSQIQNRLAQSDHWKAQTKDGLNWSKPADDHKQWWLSIDINETDKTDVLEMRVHLSKRQYTL